MTPGPVVGVERAAMDKPFSINCGKNQGRSGTWPGVRMFQQNFKNIDDVLWKQAGGSPGLDHIKQSISMLFLNGIDDLEEQKAMESGLMDWNHEFTIRPCFQGAFWSLPEKAECETAFEWSEELV